MLVRIDDLQPTALADGQVRERTLIAPGQGSRYLTISHLEADAGATLPPRVWPSEGVHFTARGTARYQVNGTTYNLVEGSAIAFPSGSTIGVTAGPDGWEAVATTCGGCVLWQRENEPGILKVEVIRWDETNRGPEPISRRGFFSPALDNTRYLTMFHSTHQGHSPGDAHVHEVHEEALTLFGGSFRLVLNGVEHWAGPRTLMYIPPAVPVAHSAGAGGAAGIAIGCEACPLGGPPYGPEDIRQLLLESNPSSHFRGVDMPSRP